MTASPSPEGGRTSRRDGHVIGLDLLRLVAAALVVAYHFAFWHWVPGQRLASALPGLEPDWRGQLHFGWIGVEIFFVISGFVIAFTASAATPARFVRGRFLRLAPGSWIGATLLAAFLLAVGKQPAPVTLSLYAKTVLFWPLSSIDGVWWTLGIEVDFYILVYLLLRRGQAASLEIALVTLGLLSGVFWASCLGATTLLADHGGGLGSFRTLVLRAEGNRELQLLLVQHACFFALGAVLWKARDEGLTAWRLGRGCLLVIACLLEIVGQNGIIARAAGMDLSPLPAAATWLAALALFVVAVARDAAIKRSFGRLNALIRFGGLVTYPLYLTHNAIGLGIIIVLEPMVGSTAIVLAMLAALGCAAVVTAYVEPPGRRLTAWLLDGVTRSAEHMGLPRRRASEADRPVRHELSRPRAPDQTDGSPSVWCESVHRVQIGGPTGPNA